MKININTENRPAENRPSGVNPYQGQEAAIKKIKKNPIQENYTQVPQNSIRNRTHIDAIIITQIAQGFFQKALLLSSRLGNIVSDALSSGKIKQGELDEALSGIRSTLGEIQDGILPQSLNTPQNYTVIYQYTGIQPDIPKIDTEFNEMSNIVNELSAGKIPDLKRIDIITDSITNKAATADNLSSRFISTLPVPDGKFTGVIPGEKSLDLAQNTIDLISNYPNIALQAQGNLNHETVTNLL